MEPMGRVRGFEFRLQRIEEDLTLLSLWGSEVADSSSALRESNHALGFRGLGVLGV